MKWIVSFGVRGFDETRHQSVTVASKRKAVELARALVRTFSDRGTEFDAMPRNVERQDWVSSSHFVMVSPA